MRLAGKMMCGLGALVGALLIAPPAYADEPSLSVDSITFTPGGAEVRQTITYWNLPDHTTIGYANNRTFGLFDLRGPAGATCTNDWYVGQAHCTEVSGSGVITVAYGNDAIPDQAFATATAVGGVEVRIDSLSLLATGTVTATPKADLSLGFVQSGGGASISVFSYGPSGSGSETLRITGFTQPANLPTGVCELDGLAVVCYLRELGPTVKPNAPGCGSGPTGRFYTCYSFSLTLNAYLSRALTATVSGPLPDPDPSNNSRTLFGSTAGGQPPPAPAPGGGSGGSNGNSGTGGVASPSAGGPTLVAEATQEVGVTRPADIEVTAEAIGGLATEPSRPLTIMVVVAGAGFVGGAALGGAGLLARRRFRTRPASGSDSLTLVDEP